MPGHSRSKNGVASLAYVPGIHVFDTGHNKDVDGRDKPGHDETSPLRPTTVAAQTNALLDLFHSRVCRPILLPQRSGKQRNDKICSGPR